MIRECDMRGIKINKCSRYDLIQESWKVLIRQRDSERVRYIISIMTGKRKKKKNLRTFQRC